MFKLALLSLVAVVAAQTTTTSAPASTPSIPPCVLACSQTASAATGCQFTNATCVCPANSPFQVSVIPCVLKCDAADQATAFQLQSTLCSSSTGGSSTTSTSSTGTETSTKPGSTSTTGSTTGTGTGTSPAAGASNTTTTAPKSAAMGVNPSFVGLGVATVASLIGAALMF